MILMDQEEAMDVRRLVESLPARSRLVVELVFFQGCSVADVARAQGWTPDMATYHVRVALTRLRRLAGEDWG